MNTTKNARLYMETGATVSVLKQDQSTQQVEKNTSSNNAKHARALSRLTKISVLLSCV